MFKDSVTKRKMLAAAIVSLGLSVSATQQATAGTLPFAFAPISGAGADPARPEVAEIRQLIVKLRGETSGETKGKDETAQIQARMASFSAITGGNVTYVRTLGSGAWVVAISQTLTPTGAKQLADQLVAGDPQVQYAHPDFVLHSQLMPNDPLLSQQWHLASPGANAVSGVNAPSAWDITRGGGITVAVVDTGYTDHPDLLPNILPGYDFMSDAVESNDGDARDSDARDPGSVQFAGQCESPQSFFHGTHVAGTIAAVGGNGQGVVGVAYEAKILPVRVLGRCGNGQFSDVVDGVRWAVGETVAGVPANPNPARVVNLSLGGVAACFPEMQGAINAAAARNVLVVVAAGNFSADVSGTTPANCGGVVTVAALDRQGALAPYSNFGAGITVSAPGGVITSLQDPNGVLSTHNAGPFAPSVPNYVFGDGTSFAAPHVSGIAALMYAQNPSLTPAQATATLRSSARPFAGNSNCNPGNCGAGMVDARRTLNGTANIVLNQGLSGAWFNPVTSGQGFALEVNPVNQLIYSGWYTYGEDGSGQQRWYTLFGNYAQGDRVKTIRILRNTGGTFDAPPMTTADDVGEATIAFQSCTMGTLSYRFFAGGLNRSGTIPLTRLSPDVNCQLIQNGGQAPAVSFSNGINEGLNAAWYEHATSGQGFQIEFIPARNEMYTAWFTYSPNSAGSGPEGQSWYSILGTYASGATNIFNATIYRNIGGNFDTPPITTGVPVGTADILFQSCHNATLNYRFNDGRVGQIPLDRLTANTSCTP